MPIKSIIVDDEKDARDALTNMLTNFFEDEIKVNAAVSSVKEAVKAVNTYKPDLIFLDIEMPNQNGFSLFDYFPEECGFEVIFVTAYNQYALKAIQTAALDYILKPINPDELERAINRYKKRSGDTTSLRINTFLSNLDSDMELNQKIVFPTNEKYILERLGNLVYCKAEVNYTRIYSKGKKDYVVTSTLKKLENTLPDDLFIRVHKSYLINLDYVDSIDKKNYLVILDENQSIPVAQKRVNQLLEKLQMADL